MINFFCIALVCLVVATAGRRVVTDFGPVVSADVVLHNAKVIETYLGVPYARPPLGNLRFRAPEDPIPWTEDFVANKLRSACPQGLGLLSYTHPGWNDTNEDCLHLNLFVPQDSPNAPYPYPVMVWFHGGGYTGSANIQYSGHFLAMKDVIVVVPNYRLGHLGFISTNDEAAWGNWGMMDQTKVLHWVQSQIRRFGGDPTKVTIFGQSAGGSSVSLHTFSPMSRGLFSQVIAESGSDIAVWAVNWPNQNPENYTRQVAEKLNCLSDDNLQMIECLRTIPAEELRTTSFNCKPGHFCQGFAPVVDHPNGYLPKTTHEYRMEGDFEKVPLMSGICSEDGSLYLLSFVPEALLGGFNRTEFNYYLRERLVGYFSPRFTPEINEDVYQANNFFYSPWPHIHDEDRNRHELSMMVTDFAFAYPMNLHLKDHAQYNPSVYQYIMGFRGTNATDIVPEWMGVPHMGELPYVWGYPFLDLNPAVRDNMQMHFDIIDWNEEDLAYAEFITTLWSNFAKFGDPTPTPVQKPLSEGTIHWDKSRFGYGEYNYINMYREVEMAREYRQLPEAFWTQYMPYVSKLPVVPVANKEQEKQSPKYILESDRVENTVARFIASLINKRKM